MATGPLPSLFERTLDLLFIPFVCFIVLARIQDRPAANIVIIIVGVIYATRTVIAKDESFGHVRFNWVDLSVLIVIATEILNYFASTYRLNTLSSLTDVLFLFLLYWLIRLHLKHEYQLVGVLLVITVFAAYLSGRVIYGFWSQYQYIHYLNFADISDLRERINLLNPDGVTVGEWITLFLTLLPFPLLIMIRSKKVFSIMSPLVCFEVLILIAIALSFSRGLYISAFSFFFIGTISCWYCRLFSLPRLLLFNGVLVLVLSVAIASTPALKPVLTTLSIFKTSSQARSLQGRLSIWATAIQMARAHPLLGIGSYNFAMQYVTYKLENAAYAGRALNCFLQILVEKGAIGLSAYCLLLFGFFKTSYRRFRSLGETVFVKTAVVLFVTTCAAALIRDMSYSSILTNKGVASLLCFMFAHNAGSQSSKSPPDNSNFATRSLFGAISMLALVTFAWVELRDTRIMRGERAFRSFAHNFVAPKKDLGQAGQDMEGAIIESPDNAYYISSQALLSVSTMTVKFEPERFLKDKLDFGEEDRARIGLAISLYNRALELNPGDDCFHHNLGWLYYFLREPELAFIHIRKAIEISGDTSLYHVSLGLLYESTHEQGKALGEYALAIRISPSTLDSGFFRDLQKRLPKEADDIVKETTSYFESQVRRGNDPLSNANLGKFYYFAGRIDDAIKSLQESTIQLPSLSRPWINLGRCYELNGRESEVKLFYERAVFLDPLDYIGWAQLGDFAYRRRELTPAIGYYQRALTGWFNQSSNHAQRVFRIYRVMAIMPNDIFPTNLLSYSEPSFDASSASFRLAEMYRESGNQAASSYFDSLGEQLEHGN